MFLVLIPSNWWSMCHAPAIRLWTSYALYAHGYFLWLYGHDYDFSLLINLDLVFSDAYKQFAASGCLSFLNVCLSLLLIHASSQHTPVSCKGTEGASLQNHDWRLFLLIFTFFCFFVWRYGWLSLEEKVSFTKTLVKTSRRSRRREKLGNAKMDLMHACILSRNRYLEHWSLL